MTRPESSGSGLFLSNASKLTLQLKFAACFKRDEGVFRESERHRGNRACSSTVEQGTHNPLVLGSNPGGPTKTFKARSLLLLAFSFASFRYWESARFVGSGLCSRHGIAGYAFLILSPGHRRNLAVRAIMGAMKMPPGYPAAFSLLRLCAVSFA